MSTDVSLDLGFDVNVDARFVLDDFGKHDFGDGSGEVVEIDKILLVFVGIGSVLHCGGVFVFCLYIYEKIWVKVVILNKILYYI